MRIFALCICIPAFLLSVSLNQQTPLRGVVAVTVGEGSGGEECRESGARIKNRHSLFGFIAGRSSIPLPACGVGVPKKLDMAAPVAALERTASVCLF